MAERVIPGSRRPDGTYRKERRVRAGFTPQEEAGVYVSAGSAVRKTIECMAVRCEGELAEKARRLLYVNRSPSTCSALTRAARLCSANALP